MNVGFRTSAKGVYKYLYLCIIKIDRHMIYLNLKKECPEYEQGKHFGLAFKASASRVIAGIAANKSCRAY